MQLTLGSTRYEWIENWVTIPQSKSGRENGRTHGAVVAANGDVLIFNQARPGVLRFDSRGKMVNAWGDRFLGAHGMTIVREGESQYLWLTDQNSTEVVKTTLDGETVLALSRPPHPMYAAGKKFAPTWVAVNEERFGGNGDVWLTDGYGSNLIHRYTKDGGYVGSINGTEGKAGAFACPHAIRFDDRRGRPELYIADRSNKRIQVYDADGKYLRHFGQDFLHSPCMFERDGDRLIVPELYGRLAVLDRDDALIGYLGEHAGIEKREGWPNNRAHVTAGKFNSPHGMAADRDGNLYIVEWILGGRITKLEKVAE